VIFGRVETIAALAVGNLLLCSAGDAFAAARSARPFILEQSDLARRQSFIEFAASDNAFLLNVDQTNITTFKLIGTDKLIYTQDVIEIALMRQWVVENDAFCAALVNKSFYSAPVDVARAFLVPEGPRAGIRDVIWYDGRLTQELVKRKGENAVESPNCNELIRKYDYPRAERILKQLDLGSDLGPFLLTIDLVTGKYTAISFSHYNEEEMEALIPRWNAVSSFSPTMWGNMDTAGARWLSWILSLRPPSLYFNTIPRGLRF
jgi:hypothetical protein